MKTFDDGLDEAVNLLGRFFHVFAGECSASALHPCKGATPSNRLYITEIEKLYGGSGDFADGIDAAIQVLSRNSVQRTQDGMRLVPVKNPDQHMSLYISRLQALK
jgi:hypothetical protein